MEQLELDLELDNDILALVPEVGDEVMIFSLKNDYSPSQIRERKRLLGKKGIIVYDNRLDCRSQYPFRIRFLEDGDHTYCVNCGMFLWKPQDIVVISKNHPLYHMYKR